MAKLKYCIWPITFLWCTIYFLFDAICNFRKWGKDEEYDAEEVVMAFFVPSLFCVISFFSVNTGLSIGSFWQPILCILFYAIGWYVNGNPKIGSSQEELDQSSADLVQAICLALIFGILAN